MVPGTTSAQHGYGPRYNIAFRALFLFTLKPTTAMQKLTGKYLVVGGTVLFNAVEVLAGWANVVYLCTLGLLGAFVSYPIFLVGTSFVHYARYIGTYCWRTFHRTFHRNIPSNIPSSIPSHIPSPSGTTGDGT